VVSYDTRIEWARPNGDLLALGFFYKEVENPLEKMNLDGSEAIAEVFYNNPNPATLMGVEFEARKTLDFFGDEDNFMKYFSVGGNFTLIDAEIEEFDSIRALHEEGLVLSDGTVAGGGFNTSDNFETTRGLVNQPEWIANLYASFDQPDWGTRATLSAFSESDVLDSSAIIVGGAKAIPRRYRESYMEVNFTLSQRITDWLTFSFSVKNLTDSTRRVVYDGDVVPGVNPEREYTLGRTYSFSLTGEF
jgi:outer membrane receptor protein involved in Fe transport